MGLQMFPDTDIDDADVTFSGRVFHSRAAATGKARSLMVERRVRRTTSDMMSTQSGDADKPRQQMTDVVPQQGTAELSGVGICIPEQPA